GEFARAFFDGAIDVIDGHIHRAGLHQDGAQARVETWIAATVLGGYGHLLAEFGKEFAAFGVDGALVMLDLRPSGMSGHNAEILACWAWAFHIIYWRLRPVGRGWWNWQTRTLEGRMAKAVQVQVLSRAPNFWRSTNPSTTGAARARLLGRAG